MARIVIALGGNALGNSPKEQEIKVETAAKSLVELVKQGHEIIVSHGNGPQVGMINLAFDEASKVSDNVVPFELMECTAMSQGYIGYHLQKAIAKELRNNLIDKEVTTIVSQIEVDKNDPAFKNPAKPIGAFYSKHQADELTKKDPTLTFVEDSGRGYRRVVASPKPVDILEKKAILTLLNNDFIVVACGGGAIPVIKDEDGDFQGTPAVIDKDFASAKLAELVNADMLIILTAIDNAMLNFEQPNQYPITKMTTKQAIEYCNEGHFAPGSMLPKVEAGIIFASSKEGRTSVIASLEQASLAIQGKKGTIIHL